MSRLARRRLLIIAAATAAVLVAPAAASAVPYTVKSGDGGCGPGDSACGGFAEAAAAAAPGDVFTVSPGIYPGATFDDAGLTINGQAGVLVNSPLTFSGTGAVSKLSKVAVAVTTGTAVVSTGSGLALSDTSIGSADGDGVTFAQGTANKIERSVILTGAGTKAAVRVTSADTGSASAKELLVESSLLVGGFGALSVNTGSGGPISSAGDVTVRLRHVTAAGATHGLALDATKAINLVGGPAGNITADVRDSLIEKGTAKAVYGGVVIVAPPNTINDTYTRTLTDFDSKLVFADPGARNYRLRPNATAAIGQGSVTAGESTTDFEGEDRSAAPTDLGGDEFNNAPPVAKLVVATKTPRATQAVRFDAAGSTDREATYGGGIVQYQWVFSDGATQSTATPTVDHVFTKEGNAAAQLTVVDRQGAASAPVAVQLLLIDGTAPAVSIVKPKNKAKINLFTTKTTTTTVDGKKKKTTKKTRTKIVFGGLSKDPSGVAAVILTLEKLPAKTTSAQASQTTATTAKCNWFNPKKGIVRRSCLKPVFITAALKKDSKVGEWSYTVKRNLTKGQYRLSAVGVDKTGAVGNAGGSKLGVVRFTLK